MEGREPRPFAFQREITLALGGLLMSGLVAGGVEVYHLSIAVQNLAKRDTVATIASDVDSIKVGRVYEKIENERRFGALERAIDRMQQQRKSP